MSRAKKLTDSINDQGPGANVGTNIIRNAIGRIATDHKLMKDTKKFLGASPEAKKAVKMIGDAIKIIKKSL